MDVNLSGRFCQPRIGSSNWGVKPPSDSNSANLILTSPPYFAVQTYAYDNWLRLWFLGHNYKEIHKIQVNTNGEEKYAEFMKESFREMFRVLKPDSFAFIVVGDIVKQMSKGPKLIKTAEFLSPLAHEVGFRLWEPNMMRYHKQEKYLIVLLEVKELKRRESYVYIKENLSLYKQPS